MFKYHNQELRVLLENETSKVKAEVEALCKRSVSVKEQAELDMLVAENLSKEEVKEILQKRGIISIDDRSPTACIPMNLRTIQSTLHGQTH